MYAEAYKIIVDSQFAGNHADLEPSMHYRGINHAVAALANGLDRAAATVWY